MPSANLKKKDKITLGLIGTGVLIVCCGGGISAVTDDGAESNPTPSVTTAQPNTIADLVPTTTEATPDAVRKSIEAAAEASREAEREAEQKALDKEREELRKQQEEEARQAEDELEQQEDEPEPAYYSSCADARASGAAPLRRGEPGYRKGLDRDNDGIACDT
jgi:hypothetical protein